MKEYKPRIVDEMLAFKLAGTGAVLIEGPKWCGKTTTAMQQAKSVLRMDDPQKRDMNIEFSQINPAVLLDGETPRLIDEWQIAPRIWDSVRYEVDKRGDMGQFILTGSAVPIESKEIMHSGTGRISWLTMRPMSLFESGESSGEISLKKLFDGETGMVGKNSLTFEDIAFLVCRGGWPQAVDMKGDVALSQAYNYYDAVVHSGINRADGVTKNIDRVMKLMQSYARYQGTQASVSKLRDDIMRDGQVSISEDSVVSYLKALKKLFMVDNLHAWHPTLRTKTAVRSAETRYFVDSSIAAAALGIGPKDLVNDLNTFGLLFETMCIRDLRVYAEALNGDVYHYRDKVGLECDAVIHLRNGSYGLIEVKLGGDKLISEGCENLQTLRDKIDTTKMKEPSFMMILTAVGDYAYQREDGIWIVPIGCLRN